MTVKVIQWATGSLGTAILKEIIDDPQFELVGCFVYSDEKVGRDVGELIGRAPIGIKASNSRSEMLALEADVVFHTALTQPDMTENDNDVLQLLRSGKNVISLADYIWPPAKSDTYARLIEEACSKGKSTLHGTGEYPGFWMERIVTTLTGLSRDVQHIEFTEYYDLSFHPFPTTMFQLTGVGSPPENIARESPVADMLGNWFGQVLRFVTDSLDIRIDRIERNVEVAPASRDIKVAAGTVKEGTVANISWSWTGYIGAHPFITLRTRWYTDKEAPGWQGAHHHYWDCYLEGTPSIRFQAEMGHSFLPEKRVSPVLPKDPLGSALVAVVVNAVPAICAAPPGIFRFPVGGMGKVNIEFVAGGCIHD